MNFLPGWGVGMMMAAPAAAGVETLSFVSQLNSASGSITLPAGLSGTDLIIYGEFAFDETGGEPSAVAPPDFTAWITGGNGIDARYLISYKIAEVSDSSAVINIAMSAPDFGGQAYFVYRANTAISSIIASTPVVEVTNGNPSSQLIAAGSVTPPVVGIGLYANAGGSVVNPRTMSPAKDGEIAIEAGFSSAWMARKLYNTSPADITVDMDDEGVGNILGSGSLQVV